jgi:hypothetical protein
MIEVTRLVRAGADAVFAVLADGWTYPVWVVGTARVYHVDPDWPAVGSCLRHSLGAWPCQLRDVTRVRAVEPGRSLDLDVWMGWLGRAVVRLRLTERAGGTEVGLAEQAVAGPAGWLPTAVQAPMWRPRNAESLSRLADLVHGRVNPAGWPHPS